MAKAYLLKMPDDVHMRLKIMAARLGISLKALIETALRQVAGNEPNDEENVQTK